MPLLRRRPHPLLCAALLALPSCTPRSATSAPDVVLVVVDTLRADHLSAYGYGRATSPTIDRIAAEGALFECAYAPMGTTTPSHAALFTSRHPLGLGLVRNGMSLKDEAATLAEALAARGYATAAFVSSFPVSRRFNLDQGFQHFDDHFAPEDSKTESEAWEGIELEAGFDRSGQATLDAALAWLQGTDRAQPLFLWVHFFDTHSPYSSPAESRSLFVREDMPRAERSIARYDAAIRHTDDLVARLAESLREHRDPANLLFLLTSDHGEGLMDHGWRMHNRTTYEEETRIPLIVRWPGRIAAGLRIEQPAHLVDLAPTLLAAVGAPPDPGHAGLDLWPHLVAGAAPDKQRPLFLQRPFYEADRARAGEVGPGFGLRVGEWKYFEARGEGHTELYRLDRDPAESVNLSADHPEKVQELAARIDAWRRLQKGDLAEETAQPADLEVLKAMGYAE